MRGAGVAAVAVAVAGGCCTAFDTGAATAGAPVVAFVAADLNRSALFSFISSAVSFLVVRVAVAVAGVVTGAASSVSATSAGAFFAAVVVVAGTGAVAAAGGGAFPIVAMRVRVAGAVGFAAVTLAVPSASAAALLFSIWGGLMGVNVGAAGLRVDGDDDDDGGGAFFLKNPMVGVVEEEEEVEEAPNNDPVDPVLAPANNPLGAFAVGDEDNAEGGGNALVVVFWKRLLVMLLLLLLLLLLASCVALTPAEGVREKRLFVIIADPNTPRGEVLLLTSLVEEVKDDDDDDDDIDNGLPSPAPNTELENADLGVA